MSSDKNENVERKYATEMFIYVARGNHRLEKR